MSQPSVKSSLRTIAAVSALFFVGTSVWFVAMTLVAKPAQAWAGLLFLGLGVPVYYAWKRQAAPAGPEDQTT